MLRDRRLKETGSVLPQYGRHTARCPGKISNGYVKRFREALASRRLVSSQLSLLPSTVYDVLLRRLKLPAYKLQFLQNMTREDHDIRNQFA
jgi:hypothetical protein